MKTARKLFAIMAIVLAMSSFAGCYVVSSGEVDKVEGTYILDEWSRTYPAKEGEEEGEKHDYIKENDVIEYVVVKGDGTGYLVRKSGSEEIYATKVLFEFEYDTEDTSKISYVAFKGSVTGQDKFGVHVKKLSSATTLNVTFPNIFNRGHSDTYRYKRVSKKTDLSYVTKKLGSFTVQEIIDDLLPNTDFGE